MASELSEILNSINLTKVDLMRGDGGDEWKRKYSPYVVNHCLMAHIDTVMMVNEMNIRHGIDKQMQYDFLLNIVEPRKRFAKWLKPEQVENLEVVKEYCGYGDRKAREALSILTAAEIDQMKQALYKGGVKRERRK